MSWEEGRPVLGRLPAKGFLDNPVADTLTSWVDQKLVDKASQLQELYKELDPLVCQSEALDFLAYLVALSGPYWSVAWPEASKRDMIAESYSLFRSRGTLRALNRVIEIMGLEVDLWLDGQLRLPFQMPGTFKTNKMRVFLRVPLAYQRSSYEWKEVERIKNNWVAASVDGRVTYRKFALGFSKLGDPMFK